MYHNIVLYTHLCLVIILTVIKCIALAGFLITQFEQYLLPYCSNNKAVKNNDS